MNTVNFVLKKYPIILIQYMRRTAQKMNIIGYVIIAIMILEQCSNGNKLLDIIL
mgnify:FL=1